MQTLISVACLFLIAALPVLADEVEQRETVEKTFAFSGTAAREVIVDNVEGSIQVTARPGSEVRLVAREHLRADSPEDAAKARREVTLDISQDANTVRFYVDGPFRCRDGGIHMHGRERYRVHYDFEVQVPSDTAVKLKTVNDGEIKVDNITGDYDVDNINGGIQMTEVSGSGRVYALNGRVQVVFRENPRAASSFGSLNGEVRVSFQTRLAADLRFKTFNGGVYTDFPVTYLPVKAMAGERHNGKFVYKGNEWSSVRVSGGGPELSFDAFNGDIRILSRDK